MVGIITYLIISIGLGMVWCLWGKKLYFPLMMASAFISILGLSVSLGGFTVKNVVLGTLFGVVAAAAVKFLYKAGLFLIGFMIGGGLGFFLAGYMPAVIASHRWMVLLVLGLVVGVCAVKFCDTFIMLFTSYTGASMVVTPLCFLIMEHSSLASHIYADGVASTITNLRTYISGDFTAAHMVVVTVLTMVGMVAAFAYQMAKSRKMAIA
jgi:hypothetical protein